jgi:hypothetical protein
VYLLFVAHVIWSIVKKEMKKAMVLLAKIGSSIIAISCLASAGL